MRPVTALFTDVGRIVTRGWAPILVISLSVVVNLAALQDLFNALGQLDGAVTPREEEQLRGLAEAAFPRGWQLNTVLGVVALLVSLAGTAFQTSAVNRIGIDAASGEPVTWAAGWRGGLRGGPRLLLAMLVIGLVALVAVAGAAAVVALLATVAVPLAFAAGSSFVLAGIVVSVWLTGRLAPISAAAPMGPGPLRWSWQHTRGRTLAVLGRWLLWSILISIVLQVVSSIVLAPVWLISDAALSSGSFGAAVTLTAASVLLSLPVSIALNGLASLGAVPIWRDLTTMEPYAAIPAGDGGRQPSSGG
jgi:hypothetical protein